jgi:hypothetical protein
MTDPGQQPSATPAPPADTLNDIGVLKRREIEARVIGPLVERFAAEFGRERVVDLTREVVVEVARGQGQALAAHTGGNDLVAFAATMGNWTKDDALQIEMVEQSPARFAFNVTRCRYAELYRSLGLADLGAILSCNRDATMVEGFNPDIRFSRTQTIMGGASHCDFRYEL